MTRALSAKQYSSAQKRAFELFDTEISVSAGAGSGKTSILVERFIRAAVEKGIPPSRILAITFTDKAANEMKTRLVSACRERGLTGLRRDIENATISTIHGFCARLLKENPIEAGLDPEFRVLNESEAEILAGKALDAVLDEGADNARWMALVSSTGEEAARGSIRKLYDLYRATGGDESLFACGGAPNEKARKAELVRAVRRFRELFDAEKRRLSCYDFDDLLFLAHKLLSDPLPSQAAVRERYRKHFRLVLVDEYQDVSPLQDSLVHLLKNDDNLFIVGDIQQSIYGFRHAEPEVFRRRIRHHREKASGKNIILAENYRSRPEILSFVNRFFKSLFPGDDFFALEPKRAAVPGPTAAVEILCLPNDKKDDDAADADGMRVREARRLALWIEELVRSGLRVEGEGGLRPVRAGDIALLLRSTSPSRLYEKELLDRGIAYTVVKGAGFFEKPEIADLMGLLTLIENPEDDIALAGVLRSPLAGVSDDALYWLSRHAKARSENEPLARGFDAFERIPELSAEDRERIGGLHALLDALRAEKDVLRIAGILERALRDSAYEAKLLSRANGCQRVANIRKLGEIAAGFEANGVVSVEDFVRFVGKLSERERLEPEAKLRAGSGDAVTVSSIHAVKGLEFPVVIIADMGARGPNKNRGPFLAMPAVGLGQRIKERGEAKAEGDEIYERISAELSAREEEESWRLLYVAMTRAKERLLLSGSLALRKKDGGFDPKSSWMGRVCDAVGHHPGRANGAFLDLDGIKLGIVPPDLPAAIPPPPARGAGRAHVWAKDFARSLSARIETRFKTYEETEDHTVTDLMAVLAGEEAAPELVEAHDAAESVSGEDERSVPANEFGTLFHRYMEHLALKRPAALTKTGAFSRIAAALPPSERAELWKQASRFWRGPWGRAMREATRVYPELPFIYKTRYGLLKGQIDLVFRTRGGRWVILDYKTHRITRAGIGRAAAPYRWQLALYALVFKKLTGEEPERGVLYFSHPGEATETRFEAAADAERERALEEAFRRAVERRA